MGLAVRNPVIVMDVQPSDNLNDTVFDLGRVVPTNDPYVCDTITGGRGRVVPSSRLVVHNRPHSYEYNGERLQSTLFTTNECRMNSLVEVWDGDKTTYKLRSFSENGQLQPLNIFIETLDNGNIFKFHNLAHDYIETFDVHVDATNVDKSQGECRLLSQMSSLNIQGTKEYNFTLLSTVRRIHVLLETEPHTALNARIELLDIEGHIKQVVSIYTSDGNRQPLQCNLNTLGVEKVRVINTGHTPDMKASVIAIEHKS